MHLAPRIFISYSRRDARFARRLAHRLKRAGFAFWRDRSHMVAGERWWPQIKQAIDNCTVLVLCMSPDAMRSEWVQKEWLYAQRPGQARDPGHSARRRP